MTPAPEPVRMSPLEHERQSERLLRVGLPTLNPARVVDPAWDDEHDDTLGRQLREQE